MISRYTHQGLTWIDLESPTREEVAALSEEFELHPIIANELLTSSERAKVDLYENAIYLILHFPIQNRTSGTVEEAEIDFVLLKNTLITTHYELIDPLHEFAKVFEVGSLLSSTNMGEHAGFLFFAQIRELYKHTLFILDSVGHDIRDIERHIFAGDEAKMVAKISNTNRALIDIRQTVRYHRETLKSFSGACHRVYGEEFGYYVNAIEGEYERLSQSLVEHRETLRDLRETNDSLLSTKTNQTIKRLTVVNVVLLPLGLISWIFSMHSTLLELNDPNQLMLVFAAMAITCLIIVIYFRSKKWL